MKPELVTPIVAYLAHDDCPVSGEAFSTAGGRLTRIVIGETQGIVDSALTLEKLPGLMDRVLDTGSIHLNRNFNDFAPRMMADLGFSPSQPLGQVMDIEP